MSVSTLSKWVQQHKNQEQPAQNGADELAQLEAENKELKKSHAKLSEEIAILKKASAYFARQMQ